MRRLGFIAIILLVGPYGCERLPLRQILGSGGDRDAEEPPPPLPTEVTLIRESGNDQIGIVGAFLDEPLVVRMLDRRTEEPVPDQRIVFEIVRGGGRVITDDASTTTKAYTVTDGWGRARARVMLSSQPEEIHILATAVDYDETVTFAVQAVYPEEYANPVERGEYALRFDGLQHHEIEVGPVSTNGDQYTVEAWIKPTDAQRADFEQEIVGQHASVADARGSLNLLGGKLRFLITTDQAGHRELMSRSSVPLDGWTHVAGVYDGRHMKVYINGELEGQIPVGGTITDFVYEGRSRYTRIGGYAGHLGEKGWFTGEIDEVRIWEAARTQEQLQTDMTHPIDPQPFLIGYWRFNEGEGFFTGDQSGQGHTGLLTNYRGNGRPAWVPGVFVQ